MSLIGCHTAPSNICGDLIEDTVLGRCICPPDTTPSEDGWSCLLPDGGMLSNPMAPDAATAPDATATCEDCDSVHCVDGRCVQCTVRTEADDCPTASAPVCGPAYECVSECDSELDCERFERTPSCASDGVLTGQCVACDRATDCGDPAAPVCDRATKTCGDCRTSDDCASFDGMTVCADVGPRAGRCVECATNADCPSPDAPRCNAATNTCVPCSMRDECIARGWNECSDGRCVECTEETAAENCGPHSCDPVALRCTSTRRDSLGSCQPCLSDAECGGDAACVPTRFGGAENGHYCLTRRPEAGCLTNDPPFRVGLTGRVSRSRAPEATYCGINEGLTTCDAVLVATQGTPCVRSDQCPEGGLCALVSSGDEQCTYPCSQGSECPVTGAVSQCSTSLPGDDFCGRR